MQQWLDRVESTQSRPVGWANAVMGGIFLLVAISEALTDGSLMLSRLLGSIGFLVTAFSNLRAAPRRQVATLVLSLVGIACLLTSAALYFAVLFG